MFSLPVLSARQQNQIGRGIRQISFIIYIIIDISIVAIRKLTFKNLSISRHFFFEFYFHPTSNNYDALTSQNGHNTLCGPQVNTRSWLR